MLGYLFYPLRYLLWLRANLRRRLGGVPDYVVFILEGAYPELRASRSGFLRRRLFPDAQPSLQELGEQFRALQQDSRIKGVVLHLRGLKLPTAHAQTIRQFITQLRSSGKRVVAWSSSYDNSKYYLATATDEILLQTGGDASPLGLRGTAVFLADALERAGVKADFVQISPYKSAADSLTRSSMSDESREMTNWLVDDYYDDFTQAIASGRNIEQEAARTLVDRAPYTDLQALDAGVVDKLISEEDLPAYLGADNRPARFTTWEAVQKRLLRPRPTLPSRHIALIRIEGPIIDGRSQLPPSRSPLPLPLVFSPRAGDLTVTQQARAALVDRRAAAVVLYVNSPGGSSTASEAMWAALQKLAAKKPLVAVMGPMAASGGYYVSTPAQWITSQPGTITGSIGVLSGKLVTAGLLDKLLFRRESIGRGGHADLHTGERPFSEEERKIVWESIKRVYDVFLDRVTASRNMSREAVDAVGGGRVWTGRQAQERGLVDELGGLEAGLAKARQLAGLHPRAVLREVRTGREQATPPLPNSASMISYALEGLELFSNNKSLCMCELVALDGHTYN